MLGIKVLKLHMSHYMKKKHLNDGLNKAAAGKLKWGTIQLYKCTCMCTCFKYYCRNLYLSSWHLTTK